MGEHFLRTENLLPSHVFDTDKVHKLTDKVHKLARIPTKAGVWIWVSEKNSSRKLAEQARLPTPWYRISMRVY